MKKPIKTKLVLSTETVRTLDHRRLVLVAGGQRLTEYHCAVSPPTTFDCP